tara:strand:+ start:82 stop:519 length:438 start_codon:yes stop_codon:yes gene_type:complete
MKILLLSLLLPLGLIGSPTSLAEYDSYKLGQAAGGFAIINDIFEKLTKSECGYVINKSYTLNKTLNEIFLYLNNKDREEFITFLDSEKFKNDLAENDSFITDTINAGKKDGLDVKTICGMLVTIASMSYQEAEKQWNYAKQHYSK